MKRIIMTVVATLVALSIAAQTIRYVTPTGAGSKNGTSWSDAYGNAEIQAAIDAAGSNYQFWFRSGTYYPTKQVGGSGERYRTFQLKNNVALYGGFGGTETQLSQRDWMTNNTILSGDIGTPDDYSDNCYHVVYHHLSGLNNTAVLDGFTITRGHANGSIDDEKRGAGMMTVGYTTANGSSQTVANCTFTLNIADNGGAVYNSRYCHPSFIGCSFFSNTANVNGGAVYNTRNNPSFTSCTFEYNQALGTGSSYGGGAMYNNSSVSTEGPSVIDCEFTGNTVSSTDARGGAILNNINPGIFTVENTVFANNSGQYGGAIHNVSGSDANRKASTITIDGCRFENNEATYGAAVFNDRHNTIISSSIFRGNYASQHGGAVYSRNGNPGTGDFGFPSIINSLITGNKAVNYGGGTYNNGASPMIINCTISGNYSARGGALACVAECAPVALNTILYGNIGATEGNTADFSSQTAASFDFCCYNNGSGDIHIDAGGTLTATNSLIGSPEFESPVAPTSGNTPNTAGNYSLSGSSPAIDAGHNDYVPGSITLDIAMQTRIQDGDNDSVSTVDMGAYECDADITLPIELSSFTASVSVNGFALLTWITQSETNLHGYYIYRNTTDIPGNSIQISGLIQAANTSNQHVYTYTDTEIYQSGTYYYWLYSMGLDDIGAFHGPVSIVVNLDGENPGAPGIPLVTGLTNIYPNPFNPSTTIIYQLENPASVRIDVFNSRGQLVNSLNREHSLAGQYKWQFPGLDFSGRQLASGIYQVIMESGKNITSRRMVLIK